MNTSSSSGSRPTNFVGKNLVHMSLNTLKLRIDVLRVALPCDWAEMHLTFATKATKAKMGWQIVKMTFCLPHNEFTPYKHKNHVRVKLSHDIDL